MHIPVLTEENKSVLQKCGEYYILNRKGASKEVYEFINLKFIVYFGTVCYIISQKGAVKQ